MDPRGRRPDPPPHVAWQAVLRYDDVGTGPPLVLVHGLASSRVVWRNAVGLLGRARRTLAIDVPGFGLTPPAGPGFDLDGVAGAVLDGLEDAGVGEPFDLVGHSMGGAIALMLAARAPDRVRRVALVAPAGLQPLPPGIARVAGAGAEQLIRWRSRAAPIAEQPWGRRVLLAAGVVDPSAISPGDTRALMAAGAQARRTGTALAAVAAADLRPLLAAPPVPLGLVWGRQDRVIPLRVAEAVRVVAPGVKLRVVEDAGHLVMVERPGAFTDAVEATLADAPAR